MFLCTNKLESKSYVIKKLKTIDVRPKEKENIENEVRFLSLLVHPNIVNYKESFADAHLNMYIVMKYCEEGDLYKKIRENNNKPFSEGQVQDWMAQLVLALHFLHEKKILHRDIKTQNIFMSKSRLFLGDFGISKSLDNTRELASTYIGTPYYMSPELFNYKPYSYKSDVWSLGCVFYEICNLRHAFNAQTINGLAIKILKGNYVPVSANFSKDLRETIHSMLQVDQKQRPSVKALVQSPFVKRIVSRHLVKFVRESDSGDLDDHLVDSLRFQIQKMGLAESVRADSEDDERVRLTLLGSRKDAFRVDELRSLKLTKELELKSELERKSKLETEMRNLREIKTKLVGQRSEAEFQEKSFREDFLDNLRASRSFIQSASQQSGTDKAFADPPEETFPQQDDYDDFEFVDDLEENSEIPKDLIESKIDKCEKKLAKNTEIISEIKSAIHKVSEKLEVTRSRKGTSNFDDSFDDLKEFEEHFPTANEHCAEDCPGSDAEEFRFASCLQDKIVQAQKSAHQQDQGQLRTRTLRPTARPHRPG